MSDNQTINDLRLLCQELMDAVYILSDCNCMYNRLNGGKEPCEQCAEYSKLSNEALRLGVPNWRKQNEG